MDSFTYLGLVLLLTFGDIQRCKAEVDVGLTIHYFYNAQGTAYEDNSSNRTCCDGPARSSCNVGDTCDTYFDICIGLITGTWKCNGASLGTKPQNNTNNITALHELTGISPFWDKEMAIFVSIRDDDTNGTRPAHNDIDRLIELLRFHPQAKEMLAKPHDFQWVGKTTLSLSLRAWCSKNFFGDTCSTFCFGISPIALCERATGQLICQYSDELLLDFKEYTPQSRYPDIDRSIHSFVANEVCNSPNKSQVLYTALDTNSNTLSFTAYCEDREISAMEFESLLLLKSDSTLTSYFPTSVKRGNKIIPKGYGQHITPNVYFGIEIADMEHPTGTSYNGSDMSGGRRCCDVNKKFNCDMELDKCDMFFSICIGSSVHGDCVGAFVESPVYVNSTSLYTCGPTLLDYSTKTARPQHPMIGAIRLTENTTMIEVTVIDDDNEGKSFDVIDSLAGYFTVIPSANVSVANSTTLTLKNFVSLKLTIIAWCAPGHSGPMCDPDNGTDTCFPGWYGDDCEMPLSPCSSNPCQHGGRCNAHDNTFNCTCPSGYQGSTCADDVNECQLGICQNGAICHNTIGGYVCNCTTGWSGIICTDNVTQCNPSPCLHGGMCSPKVNGSVSGNYVCSCGSRWHGVNCELPVSCVSDQCINGSCGVYNGYYHCLCDTGFKGYNCTEDINECLFKPCQHGSSCVNTIGAFSCSCLPGYTGLVCDSSLVCDDFVCQNNGTCVKQLGGQLTCTCTSGFTGSRCEQKIDNCANVVCENNSTCTSRYHDFQCNCSSSWSGKTCDVDVNECSRNVCKNTKKCSNHPGSYHCDCFSGWQGQNCDQDINECQDNSICLHGTCTNTNGGYTCSCVNNYSGKNCSQIIDVCRNSNCSGHGKCVEASGKCKCNPGWRGNSCQYDVDECFLDLCGEHSSNCHNTQGSYTCTCSSGWSGANSSCDTDVNECLSNHCSGNGECHNTVGSYTCQCYNGFTGTDCKTFVNKCTTVVCQHDGSCHVTANGTKCVCTNGWTGNICETDVNECISSPCMHNGTCSNSAGSFTCSCSTHWHGDTCQQDTNECLNGVCKHGVCTNTPGGYKCTCRTGWTGNNCETDVNECISSPCMHNGTCSNSAGSFTCSCSTHWHGDTCQQDTNECLNGVCKHGVCTNTPGGYKCTCRTGWAGTHCEFQTNTNISGSLFEIAFAVNVTANLKQEIISSLYRFVHVYICNNEAAQLYIKYVVGPTVQFKGTCHGHSLTLQRITDAVRNVSASLMKTMFPLPFVSVHNAAGPTTPLPDTPWVNNHWWVIVVACGCAIIIITAIVIIRCRRNRSVEKENEGFNNPTYSSEYT